MSTRKRPLAALSAPPQQHTPGARSAPSTPYTRRALEQRSAAKQRSAQGRKSLHAGAQPLSISAILRRLAKATATKSQRTPLERGKENVEPDGQGDSEEDEEDAYISPRLMRFAENVDEEDSEVLVAPTPSVLPDDDEEGERGGGGGDPTLTIKAIDFARASLENGGAGPASEKVRRSGGRVSFAPTEGDEDDEDDTVLTAEVGRRAMSEEPLDRYNRNSFGSIRMSDFALEEQRRQSGKTVDVSAFVDDYVPDMGDEEVEMDLTQGGETMDLRRLRRAEDEAEEDLFVTPGGGNDDEGTFLLQMPEVAGRSLPRPTISPSLKRPFEQPDDLQDEDFEDVHSASDEDAGPINTLGERSPSITRKQTPLEAAASRLRKKFKLTRHGTTVPSLPTSLIKRIAIDARTRVGKKKPVLGKDHIKALEQATEWFFEQVGEDLEAYSNHAKRKKRVIGDDVLTLMRRQRLCKKPGELAKLAKEWLPRKVLEELDLPDEL
jgi:histone H3/H4